MKFLSVCSGIEAASCAWEPLGWKAHAFAEIEAFPCAVLKHHYPDTPNWGDMTKFAEWPDADVDVLVGGTPCQSFSVAGLRKGLADPRGNLALTFLAIAARYSPRYIIWENVPGVLSSEHGRDFGAFLGGLGQCGYGWAYRVLDAQYFGVPQRRRRVFVVGHIGNWRSAAAVLFERHSLSGHPAPRREKGPSVAALTANGVGTCGADDNQGQAGHLIHDTGPSGIAAADFKNRPHGSNGNDPSGRRDDGSRSDNCCVPEISHCLNAGGMGRQDYETETLIAFATQQEPKWSRNVCPTLTVPSKSGGGQPHCIAFTAKDHGADASDISPTLRSGSHSGSHANGGVMPAVAFNNRQDPIHSDAALPLGAKDNGNGLLQGSAVRRLTPRECERLQGFPDDYTLIPYRGKPAADGPRYKALGNSMAVPVMRWIGERIAMVEALAAESLAA